MGDKIKQWKSKEKEKKKQKKEKMINESVATKYGNDFEGEDYIISYRYYNDKVCQINIMDVNAAKSFLKNLRIIGKSTFTTLFSNGIDTIPIEDVNEYSTLYRNLPPDTDKIFEHKGNGTHRLFYSVSENRFFIIAFTTNHLETDKNKR